MFRAILDVAVLSEFPSAVLTPMAHSTATAGLANGTVPPVELPAAAAGKRHDNNAGTRACRATKKCFKRIGEPS